MPGVIINRSKGNLGLGGIKIFQTKKTMASGASSGVSGARLLQKRVWGAGLDVQRLGAVDLRCHVGPIGF